MDAKTLKTYCDGIGVELIKKKPIPKNFENIIAATRARQRERDDLVWINSTSGERKYASEVAKEIGVSLPTIRKYHEQGLSLEQMRHKDFTSKAERPVTIDGVTRSFREWCDMNQIQMGTAMKRARDGYTLANAVTQPTRFKASSGSKQVICGASYIDSLGNIVVVKNVEEGFLENDVLYIGRSLSGRLPMSDFLQKFEKANEQR